MAAAFATQGSILDGMAPHVWRGPTAAQDWYRDVLLEGRHAGVRDARRTPSCRDVTGDSAYVVAPVTMTFKVNGTQVTQSAAIFTVALRELADGWRIASWAWVKGSDA